MTDSDEVKLLPCPFCGNAACMFQDTGEFFVECCQCSNRTSLHDSRGEALAIWNTRPPVVTDEVVERVETGWLIEEDANGVPLWIALAENAWPRTEVKDRRLGARGSRSFERYLSPVVRAQDANEALRFARKQDAEAFIKLFDRFLLNPGATEHEWPRAALASMPAVVSGGQT